MNRWNAITGYQKWQKSILSFFLSFFIIDWYTTAYSEPFIKKLCWNQHSNDGHNCFNDPRLFVEHIETCYGLILSVTWDSVERISATLANLNHRFIRIIASSISTVCLCHKKPDKYFSRRRMLKVTHHNIIMWMYWNVKKSLQCFLYIFVSIQTKESEAPSATIFPIWFERDENSRSTHTMSWVCR